MLVVVYMFTHVTLPLAYVYIVLFGSVVQTRHCNR